MNIDENPISIYVHTILFLAWNVVIGDGVSLKMHSHLLSIVCFTLFNICSHIFPGNHTTYEFQTIWQPH